MKCPAADPMLMQHVMATGLAINPEGQPRLRLICTYLRAAFTQLQYPAATLLSGNPLIR